MIAHRFAHALYKLMGMLKIWKLPEACGQVYGFGGMELWTGLEWNGMEWPDAIV